MCPKLVIKNDLGNQSQKIYVVGFFEKDFGHLIKDKMGKSKSKGFLAHLRL